MTTIKINAITIPAGSGDELAQRSPPTPERSTVRTDSKGSNCWAH